MGRSDPASRLALAASFGQVPARIGRHCVPGGAPEAPGPGKPEEIDMKVVVIAAAALVASAGAALAQNKEAGESVFKQCMACHDIGEDAKNKVGPELNGLDGRKSGTVEGYNYSDGNKNSGITWNEATFKEYIKDPRSKVPGTKMFFPGVKDEKKANDLWAYVSQFKADGSKK
jgi:cytochrome c